MTTMDRYPYSRFDWLGDKSDERSPMPRPDRWMNYARDAVKVQVDDFVHVCPSLPAFATGVFSGRRRSENKRAPVVPRSDLADQLVGRSVRSEVAEPLVVGHVPPLLQFLEPPRVL